MTGRRKNVNMTITGLVLTWRERGYMNDSGQGGVQDGAESGLGGIQDWGYLVLH